MCIANQSKSEIQDYPILQFFRLNSRWHHQADGKIVLILALAVMLRLNGKVGCLDANHLLRLLKRRSMSVTLSPIQNFDLNGVTVYAIEALPVLGPLAQTVVHLVGTVPNKTGVNFNELIRLYNYYDAMAG
ncbi:MAG: hypothetical protein CENE_03747 [Candidatus Celerinatantimonas neptuna]|nr:MAG: hypothetical protein CENE_03747 [Candidatus Celerinatantimonas neptuna]